jgi:hypothetical protein
VRNASFWFIIRIVRATIVAAIFKSNVRHIVRAKNIIMGFANGSGKVKLPTSFPAIKMTADLRLIRLVVSEI